MFIINETTFKFSSRRIPELDGIRGIAILLVLIWHYGVCQVTTEPHTLLDYVKKALSFTWSGVDLFFVLSGFLIGGILLDNKQAHYYFKTFYIRRICRIFPLYFLWLTLFIIIVYAGDFPIINRLNNISWLFQKSVPVWSYATFTQNIAMMYNGNFGPNWLGITWSLAVEEQFYLVLPFLIYFLSLQRLPLTLSFIIFVAPILRIALFYYYPHGGFASYVLMPCRADALLLGVLSAYLIRQEFFVRYMVEYQKLMYGLLILSLLGTSILLDKGQSIGSLAMSSFGYSLLAIMYSCFLLIAITEKRGLITVIVQNRLLGKLGIIAYGVYIFHQGISGLLHAALLHQVPQISREVDVAVTCTALVITIMISYLSWTFFEKPFMVLGHSFRYKAS